MKKTHCFFLGMLMLFSTTSFSQTYYPGNGLTASNDSFHLGGTVLKHTAIKGKYGGTRYNFSLDTFALLNYNATRVDLEGTDSVRLISNKLFKAMSGGDIHLGASNSIVLDGNVWLKNYRNPSATEPALLGVDTCGRITIASGLSLSDYLKKGGNVFGSSGEEVYMGSKDSVSLNIGSFLYTDGYMNNAKSNIVLKATGTIDFKAKTPSGSTALSFYTGNSGPLMQLGKYNSYVGMIGGTQFWPYVGSFATGTGPGNGANLAFYNNYSTGDAFTFSGDNFHQTGSGTSSFMNIDANIGLSESGSKGNLLSLATTPDFSTMSSTSMLRALYVNAGYTNPAIDIARFRAIETTRGHVAFNTVTGNTLIGTNTINGRKLQVEGDASISESLVIGDSLSDPSASLHISTNSKGFLPPRLTTANRNGIASPANGLMIYNTDSSWVEVYTPSGWYKLLSNTVTSGGGHQSRVSQETNVETTKNTFMARVGDGKTTSFTIQHNLNSELVMVQFIDCGAEANCNLLLSIPEGARLEINGRNEVQLTFKTAPAFNRYKVMFLKFQ